MTEKKKKIKYSVGLNCRPGNIEAILAEDVYEVYSAAPQSICTSARRDNVPINEKEIERQVQLAHASDVKYNLVMNGSCQGGEEFNVSFQNRIKDFVRWAESIGVDVITVASPVMLDLIREVSDEISVTISNSSILVDPIKIQRYKKRGANTFVLNWNVTRDFEMLKMIRNSTDDEIKFIPNQGCINSCEWFISHANIVSHVSVVGDDSIARYGDFDYAIKKCRCVRQLDPVEFLMSNFTRPEDLHYFTEIGFDIIKLAGRRSSTEWMVKVLRAYQAEAYDGNVFDLSSHVGERWGIVNVPNRVLDGWYAYMGNKSDYENFKKKAYEFAEMRQLDKYFKTSK